MTEKKHIVVVEDEEHLAVGIKYNLTAEGYRVTAMSDGASALEFVAKNSEEIDLIILDLMLPGMSGYAVCETLRESGHGMPVLILSARTLPEDRTRGFDVGADQYLSKPFELDELISRTKNLPVAVPRWWRVRADTDGHHAVSVRRCGCQLCHPRSDRQGLAETPDATRIEASCLLCGQRRPCHSTWRIAGKSLGHAVPPENSRARSIHPTLAEDI